MKNGAGLLLLCIFSLTSCGRLVVDTGRNGNLPDIGVPTENSAEKQNQGSNTGSGISREGDPSTSAEGVSADPSSSPSNEVPGNASNGQQAAAERITCFGKSANIAPEGLSDFCKNVPTDLKAKYAKAQKLLCTEKRFHNLFLPQCGWSGEGSLQTFSRVIESTPIEDKGEDFYYLSVSSLTLGPSQYSYPGMTLAAYSDPDEFRKKFILPAGAEITPNGQGIVSTDADSRAQYRFSVNGLTKTSFLGEVRVVRYAANLRVVFNTALKEFDGLKARQNLSIVLSLPDGREKIVIVEERLIPDGGQHQIAWSKMLKLDQAELENRLKNSKVQ